MTRWGPIDFKNVDSMALGHDGWLFINESLNDMIYMGKDKNGDGDIEDQYELILYRDGTGSLRPDASKGTAVFGLNYPYWDVAIAEYTDPQRRARIDGQERRQRRQRYG